MNKVFNFVKTNKNFLVLEIILFILSGLMFQWIVGSRQEYYTQSAAPASNGNTINIANNDSFVQELICDRNDLAGISIWASAPEAEQEIDVDIKIYNSNDGLLAESERTFILSAEGKYEPFFFDNPLELVKGETYKVVFKNNSVSQVNILLQGCEKDHLLNNESANACMRLIYRAINENIYKKIVLAAGIVLVILLSCIIYVLTKKLCKLEYIFAWLYFGLGVFYMCVIPLSGVPDEGAHMLRAYSISRGRFVSMTNGGGWGGDVLPSNLTYNWRGCDTTILDIVEGMDIEVAEDERFTGFANTALYSPFSYTPQALGILIGRILSNKIYIIAYCGRIASWMTIGFMLFFSIKYIPIGKSILMAAALLPMNMQECVSLAADGFAFAVVCSFIAYVLYMRYEKKGIMTKWQLLMLYVLAFFLASCKSVYVPIVLLAFLIPMEKFGGKKGYILNAIGAAALVMVASIGWLMINPRFFVEFTPGIDVRGQVHFILDNVVHYIVIIFNTTIVYGATYFYNLFGANLGVFSVNCNMGIVAISIANFIYIAVTEKNEMECGDWFNTRILMAIVSFFAFILVYTSLYVQWTPVGDGLINGIQGRYFLPILFPFVLSLKHTFDKENCLKFSIKYVPYIFIATVNLYSLATLLTSYIV